jgi:hypothetical protein
MFMQRVTVSTKETPAATAATSWSPLLNRNARLIQRKCACGDTSGSTGECEECSKNKRLGLQTKLKVNEPGDIYEQEADQVADQVLATSVHPGVSDAPPRIQRFSGHPNGQIEAAPECYERVIKRAALKRVAPNPFT